MKRLDRSTLEAELAVRLTRAIAANKRRLGSRFALETEAAVDAVVAEMIAAIDNASTCVVRADTVHAKMAAGKFGIDEPWPGQPPLPSPQTEIVPEVIPEVIVVPRMTLGRDGG
jgi:hypothetical protein